MKKYNQILPLALVMFSVSTAFARTNVTEKVQQLKDNVEASKVNLEQYEDNLKTVNVNLVEIEKALHALGAQKQSLAKQTSETAKGKMSVDQVKNQIDGYMKTEQAKLVAEQKQMDELKKTLALLEENSKKREANIAQYHEKMQKADSEIASWSDRNQSIVELEKALAEKEAQALADRKRLTEKKVTYEEEISKWRKQVRLSDRTYANFSKLKD
jgi:chromosome segregation ATPase